MGKNINDNTKISGNITVEEWKNLRTILLKNMKELPLQEWNAAFDIFYSRIQTRFLNPITSILEKDLMQGEGFTVVAIQCILIEFLEAFYQGKIYTVKRDNLWLYEYRSSRQLFKDFLLGHAPFNEQFSEKLAANFYSHIRCGLLHEAQTKETSKIRARSSSNLVKELDKGNMIIYRTNFQEALICFIENYKNELLVNMKRRQNFIRKMDDLCGIEHVLYFAYGSNLKFSRLLKRFGEGHDSPKIHNSFIGHLVDYEFKFNKKGKDGTSKANILKKEDSTVWGVCYEIDKNALSLLDRYEGGYSQVVVTIEDAEGNKTRAITYISESVFSDVVAPSVGYFEIVVAGAKEQDLPQSYIDEICKEIDMDTLQ
ncbi:gamma-glutamylcyclotransferase family protein [Candidatus Uabimicrobium sp. HlEnr_7]|uniref:gamma-glutamylcyclotransferase family protein n=1 Tax=Candidatus Uabimicrobium helgolandensis TaxID=3095367 RepID=UPI0035564CC9